MDRGDFEDYEPKVSSNNPADFAEQIYEVSNDLEEIKKNCALCQELPCCPDHCCDVSTTTKLQKFLELTCNCSGTLALAKATLKNRKHTEKSLTLPLGRINLRRLMRQRSKLWLPERSR